MFEWEHLPKDVVEFDLTYGSGSWSALIAYSVARLYCIDPTKDFKKAKSNLSKVGAPLQVYLYYDFGDKPCWFHLANNRSYVEGFITFAS